MKPVPVLAILVLLHLPSFSAAVLAGPPPPTVGDRVAVEVLLQNFEAQFPLFYSGDYDVAGWDSSRSVVGLVVDDAGLEDLRAAGYHPVIVAQSSRGGIDPGYMDYEEVLARLQEIEQDYPGLAVLVNLNQELSTPLTFENRVLWALKISDNPQLSEDEPAFVVDGTHHARELVTPLAVLDIAETLTQQYGVDPVVSSWVDSYEIWLIPVVNPDGLEFVFDVNNMWRKNRRYFPLLGTWGVDNNRNYSYLWGVCGSVSSDPDSEIYQGPSPESEGENKTIEALMAREKPVAYVSYHSYGQEVLYPYVCADLAEAALYHEIRDQYAAEMNYGFRIPSASGESLEDAYNEHGPISFLTEIATWFQPAFSEVPVILDRIRPGWSYLMERGLGSSLTGHVTDAFTGAPLPNASLSVQEVVYLEGERRSPEPIHGAFTRLLQPGQYTVTAECAGYLSQTYTVTIGSMPFLLDFQLQPASLVSAELVCAPAVGTLPFLTQMSVTLANLYQEQVRSIAGRINLTLANGQQYPGWRSGYTNVGPGDFFTTSWNTTLPSSVSLVGENHFQLLVEDVTPAPYNQPPYPPAGSTDSSLCVVIGLAP